MNLRNYIVRLHVIIPCTFYLVYLYIFVTHTSPALLILYWIMNRCYIAKSLYKTGQSMRFVCTRCHHWIQKKIWRRQCDIWRRPNQFLSAWIFQNLDRLHDRIWQSCMSGKGTLLFCFNSCNLLSITSDYSKWSAIAAFTVSMFTRKSIYYSILNGWWFIWWTHSYTSYRFWRKRFW